MDKHIAAMKALRDLRAYEEVLNQDEIDALDWVIGEIERLRAALVRIECEPINAEYLARAALDGPNARNEGRAALSRVPLD